jgi:cholesterol oxidase
VSAEEAAFDWIVVGSGFGASPVALRLCERGYRVLLLEKGDSFREEDFAHTNWNLRRYFWLPWLGCRGILRLSFFRHATVLTGVGLGGGSLGYAATHPYPHDDFFRAASWAHLADWKTELAAHYATARRMLGVASVPFDTPVDGVLRTLASEDGAAHRYRPTEVAVWFGAEGETVPDPYFGGEGPERTGCRRCGGCMTGCRFGAKNSLDKNYLWLARRRGLQIRCRTEAVAIRPRKGGGYVVEAREGAWPPLRRTRRWAANRVVLAAGVLGTLDLLYRMQRDPEGLPHLSRRLGEGVRTNEEAILYVVSQRRDVDHSRGVAIGSIYDTDERSSLEPVRYSAGSGVFRALMWPMVTGRRPLTRVLRLFGVVLRRPLRFLRAYLVPDFSRFSTVLLYMRSIDTTLRLAPGRFFPWLGTRISGGPPPRGSLPEASVLAERVAQKIDGTALSGVTETLFDIPTTAHILGGCCMGATPEEGVIDVHHEVFGYPGLYVVDGSALSANPGVNPSLTIAALAERFASAIPPR